MFRMSSTSPCEVQGTIYLNKPPMKLGPCKDVYNKTWDIHGIFGHRGEYHVWTVPIEKLHPYYTDTSGADYGYVSQTWWPYKVEIIKENKEGIYERE